LDFHNGQPYILAFVARAAELTESIAIYKTDKLA